MYLYLDILIYVGVRRCRPRMYFHLYLVTDSLHITPLHHMTLVDSCWLRDNTHIQEAQTLRHRHTNIRNTFTLITQLLMYGSATHHQQSRTIRRMKSIHSTMSLNLVACLAHLFRLGKVVFEFKPRVDSIIIRIFVSLRYLTVQLYLLGYLSKQI